MREVAVGGVIDLQNLRNVVTLTQFRLVFEKTVEFGRSA